MVQSLLVHFVLVLVAFAQSKQYKKQQGLSNLGTNPFINKQGLRHQPAGTRQLGTNPGKQRQFFALAGPAPPERPLQTLDHSFCNPYSCQFYDAQGFCSKKTLEYYLNAGENQCREGCTCWIPGQCPSPLFAHNHVCPDCDTDAEVLEFTKRAIKRPLPNAKHVVLDGREISYYITSYDDKPACINDDFTNVWECTANSLRVWQSCEPSAFCFVYVGLINGDILGFGCVSLNPPTGPSI